MNAIYPQVPGYKTNQPETSKQAATEMIPKAATLRQKCLECLRGAAMTPDEVAELLGEDKLSIRPRISELSLMSLVYDTKLRRKNRSGKFAVVWKAATKLEQPDLI